MLRIKYLTSWPGSLKGTEVSREERSQTEGTTPQRRPRGAGGALAMSAGDGREPTRLESPEHLLFESAVFL